MPASLTTLTWLIPAGPLAAFLIIVLFAKRSKTASWMLAWSAIIASLIFSWTVAFNFFRTDTATLDHQPVQIADSVVWMPFGDYFDNSAEGCQLCLRMGVAVDPLTAVMLFMVPFAVFMIFIYSVGYHNYGAPPGHQLGVPNHGQEEPLFSRFFAFMSLFAGAMLVLTVADNLLLLFVGWEVMGLCSYLLIGFWYARTYGPDPKNAQKLPPRYASMKAFMTTRVADVVMLLGIVAFYRVFGTLNFKEALSAESLIAAINTPSILGLSGGMALSIIALLIFTGTVGKSAQWPLHVWLPNAMEGPTPVSAVIHAAAMVSAGIYLILRIFPLIAVGIQANSSAGLIIAFIGAFTAFMAATIAVAQDDVKGVLAYSTISQLGFMVAAIGIGAYVAAAFHLITHAFFKALLFLSSGSVIHGVEHGEMHVHGHGHGHGHDHEEAGDGSHAHDSHAHDGHHDAHHVADHGHHATDDHAHDHHAADPHAHGHHAHHPVAIEHHEEHHAAHFDPQDMMNMGGLKDKMPITYWAFLIGGLALSGFPVVTAGFWSKDEIFADAWMLGSHGNALALAVFFTLATAAFLTAFYTARQLCLTFLGKPRTEEAAHAHESNGFMTVPLIALAFFAVTAGWVGIPEDFPVLGQIAGKNYFHHFVGATVHETIHTLYIGELETKEGEVEHKVLLAEEAGQGEGEEAHGESADAEYSDTEHAQAYGVYVAHEIVAPPVSLVPLGTSLFVALGGLFIGWWMYGRKPLVAGQPDPLIRALGPLHTFLRNKWYWDELYQTVFIKPTIYLSEVITYQWIDKGLIDGTLHAIARTFYAIGSLAKRVENFIFNDAVDAVINGFLWISRESRNIQTGKIQEYALISTLIAGAVTLFILLFTAWQGGFLG